MRRRLKPIIRWVLLLVFVVAEAGGIYHAFEDHSTRDGVVAIFVPPWAWYRAVESFWHDDIVKETDASPQAVEPSSGSELKPAAEPSFDERKELNDIVQLALKQPLVQSDIDHYVEVVRRFHSRTGTPGGEFNEQLLPNMDLEIAYETEVAHCMKLSIERRQAVYSPELEHLEAQMRSAGGSEQRLEIARKNLMRAALRTPWTDENGLRHRSLTAADVDKGMDRVHMVQDNMRRLAKAVDSQ